LISFPRESQLVQLLEDGKSHLLETRVDRDFSHATFRRPESPTDLDTIDIRYLTPKLRQRLAQNAPTNKQAEWCKTNIIASGHTLDLASKRLAKISFPRDAASFQNVEEPVIHGNQNELYQIDSMRARASYATDSPTARPDYIEILHFLGI
jgi:hypothetical protein